MRRASQQLQDELLVLRCQDGDAEALNELVSRWQQPLWRHARRLTGRADAAWEVTQNGWLAIVRDLPRLEDPARFRAWAYRIMTHKAADWVRRRSRDRRVTHELNPETHAAPAQPAGPAEADAVKAKLAGMDDVHRLVLVLHHVDGLTVSEIAEIVGVPVGTVKSRLHNGRAQLKRLLEGSD